MKSIVSIVKATPETILECYNDAITLAGIKLKYYSHLHSVILPEIIWDKFLPVCGSLPWHLEAAILYLLSNDHPYHALRVYYQPSVSEKALLAYKHSAILKRYSLHAEKIPVDFFARASEILLFSDTPPIANPIIFLSSFKTHVLFHISGALTTLLNYQKPLVNPETTQAIINNGCTQLSEFDTGLSNAVYLMDLSAAADGPGPFCLRPRYPGYCMASSDPVALDAVASSLIGLDPKQIPLLRTASEMNIGNAEMSHIEVVGERLREVETFFKGWIDPIPGGLLSAMERRALLRPRSLRGKLAKSIRNHLWYPMRGKRRAHNFHHEEWGMLWQCF